MHAYIAYMTRVDLQKYTEYSSFAHSNISPKLFLNSYTETPSLKMILSRIFAKVGFLFLLPRSANRLLDVGPTAESYYDS